MITAAVLAHNEEKKLALRLSELSFCDEILVIDNNSTDTSKDIANQHRAKVIQSSAKDFSHLRNLAMKEAKGDWILFVDADEHISQNLQDEILQVVKSNDYESYYICREEKFWGKTVKYGEVLQARKQGFIRLVKKNSGTWNGAVHEVFVPHKQAGRLKNSLNHLSHNGIADFIDSINRFSTLRAEEVYKKGYRATSMDLFLYPFGKFIYSYVFLGGVIDGARGFVYSFMMSFHSFLVRSKVYLMQTEKNKL